MAVCFLLTVGVPSIMRSANWAMFGLVSLLLLLCVYLTKFAALVVGVVWVWGEDHAPLCSVQTPSLFVQASKFLIGMLCVFAFQMLFGTSFLMCCGLEDAVGEGVHWFNGKYGSKTEEEEQLMPSDSDEEDEAAATAKA